jgi:hypothetical protein
VTKAIRLVVGPQAATFRPVASAEPAAVGVGAGTGSRAAQGGPGG